MKLPIDWLKEFVPTDETPKQIGDTFTMLGFETESIENEVIDLEITPNRGDVLSIGGLAREYAAASRIQLTQPRIDEVEFHSDPQTVKINNLIPDLLTRHSGLAITIDQIKLSSTKIQRHLQSVGIRPINQIVDITNYVMIELGLPLHAFDLDQIKNSTMIFRLSRAGEQIQTIDGQTHNLPEGVMVIEDQNRLIDLVGIMGAANSSIRNETKRILIHCPIIDPKSIRKTTKRLGIMSEAAYRYERLVDWGMAVRSLQRGWRLVQQESVAKLAEAFDHTYRQPPKRTLAIATSEIAKTLGVEISADDTKNFLTRLGFSVTRENESLNVQVPSWRMGDVLHPVDIIEEIARIYGYDKMPKIPLPKIKSNFIIGHSSTLKLKIADWLVGQGCQEVLTPTFVSELEANLLNHDPQNQYSVRSSADNPAARYLRPSMIVPLAKVMVRNNWYGPMKLFEIGETFANKREQTKICIAQTGDQKKYWRQYFPAEEIQVINPNHPLAKQVKLRTTVTFVETGIETFKDLVKDVKISETKLVKVNYRPYSRFTPAVRDIALIVGESTSAKVMSDAIASVDERIFLVDPFDEFKSEKFGTDKISRAFHVIFDDPKSIIVESDINSIWEKVTKIVQQKAWVIRQ